MSTLNDAILAATGGKTLNEGLSLYFARTPTETLDDAELRFLTAQAGVTATTAADAWRQYLESLGYMGTINDSKRQFWLGATPPVPVLPPPVISAVAGDGIITLTWADVPTATQYTLFHDLTAGVTTGDSAIIDVTSPYVHNTANNVERFYAMEAFDGVLTSVLSNEVSETPIPAPVFTGLANFDGFSTYAFRPDALINAPIDTQVISGSLFFNPTLGDIEDIFTVRNPVNSGVIEISVNGALLSVKFTSKAGVLTTLSGNINPVIWQHLTFSLDSVNDIAVLYVNDTLLDSVTGFSSDVYDLQNGIDWTFGRHHTNAINFYDGCLASYFLDFDNYTDMSVQANRDLFRTSPGVYVNKYLGDTGELVTGSQPIFYLVGDGLGDVINRGYGGMFTIMNHGTCSMEIDDQSFDAPHFININNNKMATTAGLDGTVTYRKATFIFSVLFGSGISTNVTHLINGDRSFISRTASKIDVNLYSAGFAELIRFVSDNDVMPTDGWVTYMISLDLDAAFANIKMYANNTPMPLTITRTAVAGDAVFTTNLWNVFNEDSEGCYYRVWVDLTDNLDFDDAAIRAKIIDSRGAFIDLGANGELLTGTSPIIYHAGNTSDFKIARGTGEADLAETGTAIINCASQVPLLPDATSPPQGYFVNKVKYGDGSNYLHRTTAFAGQVDSSVGIFSCQFRVDITGNTARIYRNRNARIQFVKSNTGKIQVFLNAPGGADLLTMETVNSYDTGEHSLLISWDLTTVDANKVHLYVDDVLDISITVHVAGTINYTETDHIIASTSAGFNIFSGCMNEIVFNSDEYLDFSVEANRRLFFDASGNPVSKGVNGEIPTGNQPVMYLKELFSTAGVNAGYGGDFGTVGTLIECPPSLITEQIVVQSDFNAFDYLIDTGLSSDGLRLVTGAPAADVAAVSSGSAWAYSKAVASDPFADEQKLLQPSALLDDKFGHGVAISTDGLTIAVAAHEQAGTVVDGGAVYVYKLVSTTWTYQFMITPAGGLEASAKFGFSLSISDDGALLLVGEPFRNNATTDEGQAYIYDISGGAATELAILTKTAPVNADALGYTVHLSGDGLTAFVGAPLGSQQGLVCAYVKPGGGWVDATQDQIIQASDGASLDYFGAAVNDFFIFSGQCITSNTDGSKLFIGAHGRNGAGNNRGGVYYFTGVAGVWTEQQIITAASFDEDFHWFAYSLTCDATASKLIVGAQSDDVLGTNTGRIYLFKPTPTYTEDSNITASVPQVGAFFGYRPYLSGDGKTVAVVASDHDGGATDTGAAFILTVN